MSIRPAWSPGSDGVLVRVRLTPKSSHDRIEGIEARADGLAYVKARVRAPPEDGKANEALIRLLAEALGVARSSISLASGASGRLKVLKIIGEPAGLEAKLLARFANKQ